MEIKFTDPVTLLKKTFLSKDTMSIFNKSKKNKNKNIFYFGLEPLKARYTYQLSKKLLHWLIANLPLTSKLKLELY